LKPCVLSLAVQFEDQQQHGSSECQVRPAIED
jgi:hypothetical protein